MTRSANGISGIVCRAVFAGVVAVCLAVPVPRALATETLALKSFATPEDAAKALVTAVKAGDKAALLELFGPGADELASSGDDAQDKRAYDRFAALLSELTAVSKHDDTSATILIGHNKWPFAVPLVKRDGGWVFDSEAGKTEIIDRRVGENELKAIRLCRAFVQAQEAYRELNLGPDGLAVYARKLVSDEGTSDGLCWPSEPGEPDSPLSALALCVGGETRANGEVLCNGYVFRILDRQGRNAPGGACSYVVNGNMVSGFALIAYPVHYRVSGIMTFVVNQLGEIHQKDLGGKTSALAGEIGAYNPNATWVRVEDE